MTKRCPVSRPYVSRRTPKASWRSTAAIWATILAIFGVMAGTISILLPYL